MFKKTSEDIRLLIAQLINEENDRYSLEVKSLNYNLSAAKDLLEILSFAHKEKIELLDRIYKEI